MKNSQGKINFLIIGDMGKGTKEQYKVADSMSKLMKEQKYSFIHGLGDNIYPDGCKDTNDPLFKSNFKHHPNQNHDRDPRYDAKCKHRYFLTRLNVLANIPNYPILHLSTYHSLHHSKKKI